MATIGVHAIKGNVQDAINYIINEEKTESIVCESKNCNMYSAGIEWKLQTNRGKRRNVSIRDDVVGYHFRQSFAEGTVNLEEAFEITKEWIEKITQGNYDYVIATHKDKKHIHTHVIVNPISNIDGKKMNIFYKKDVSVFKKISDDICLSHNLQVLDLDGKGISRSYYEWQMKNKGDSHKEIIRKAIDNVIPIVKDFNEFKGYLTKLGFTVEDGSEEGNNRKGLRIKVPNGKRFIRCNSILDDSSQAYTFEEIMTRIENNGVFITTKEVNNFLGSEYSKKQIQEKRAAFYEDSNIKLNFKETVYSNMSSFEKMLFAKKRNITKMLKEIHEMNIKNYGASRLGELKDQRSQLQDRINNVTKLLSENEASFKEMMQMRMDDILNISDGEVDEYLSDRILPLRQEKEVLKKEIAHLSEIINKTETAIRKNEKDH